MISAGKLRAGRVPVALLSLCSFLSSLFAPLRAALAEPGHEPSSIVRDLSDDVAAGSISERAKAEVLTRPDGRDPQSGTADALKLLDSVEVGTAGAQLLEKYALSSAQLLAGGPPTGAGVSAGGGTDVGSGALALPSGAATVGGPGDAFSTLLSTGAATYSVPFPLLRARGLAQPTLSLSYSSDAGSGVAGIGWTIGVPYVARSARGVPSYASGHGFSADRFVFNGADLVPICTVSGSLGCSGKLSREAMPAWSAGWTYFRPRIESQFQRLFLSPDERTWRLQDRSGLQAEFGVPLDGTGDTSALETNPEDSSQIFRWNVARQYDANGSGDVLADASPQPYNKVVYRYVTQGGIGYLTDVYDTPPVANPVSAPLSAYAHHTHLNWDMRPDAHRNYRRGWLVLDGWRLARVDVTSMPFAGGAVRRMTTRTHLGYEAGSHASLLSSIQAEGRCSGEESMATAEQGDGTLPVTSCPRLPPIRLEYTHVRGSDGNVLPAAVPGFEGFSTAARSFASSPPVTVSDGYSTLIDANADGLPDVLNTNTANAAAPGRHVLYLNGPSGTANRFGPALAVSMSPSGAGGIPLASVNFQNPNLLALDLDGSGTVDFAFIPFQGFVQPLTLNVAAGAAQWIREAQVRGSAFFTQLNLGTSRARVNVVDVNGDGAVDIVQTDDAGIKTYFALSSWPGGNGAFGSAHFSGSGFSLSSSPVTACVPIAGSPVTFNSPGVRVADMNGDGLPDLVRVGTNSLFYWPGRGDGHWGTGSASDCSYGSVVSNIHLEMAGAPVVSNADDIRLGDLNGDGLADLLQMTATTARIWLNVDGTSLSRLVIVPAPVTEPVLDRVRTIDINGSGTQDIVWADAGSYRYLDLQGGTRPWLLTRVSNGFGRTTDIDYSSSTEEMLAAAAGGHPWTTKSPVVVPVVKSVTVRDHLDLIGRATTPVVTTYTYADPHYDARRGAFRGFGKVVAKAMGDASHPTTITESRFLSGACVDEDAVGRCDAEAHALDNLREALVGRPVFAETKDENGVVLQSAHTVHRLRTLYTGLDGREVRHAFVAQSDTFRYDTGSFVASPQTINLVDVEFERTLGTVENDPAIDYVLAASAGRANIRSSTDVDEFGNVTVQIEEGCVSGCSDLDEAIASVRVFDLLGDGSAWLWRPTESYVSGWNNPTERRSNQFFQYDARGNVVATTAALVGTLPLTRMHSASGAIAPAPAGASSDGLVTGGTVTIDAFGNTTRTTLAGASCASTTYDPTYGQLPVLSTGYVGDGGPDGCGLTELVTTAEYDRGLEAVTRRTGPNGEVAAASYDGFGRVIATYAPDTANVGQVSTVPTATYAYSVTPDSDVQPWSAVFSSVLGGASGPGTRRESWVYTDGLGRTLLALEQADPTAGDGGTWLAGGYTSFDAKGEPKNAHKSWFWTGNPQSPPFEPPSTSFAWSRKDAFGRVVDTYGIDGAWMGHVRYHAMSVDRWDAGHLAAGILSPSYFTETSDGHGRAVNAIQRYQDGATLKQVSASVAYLPTGEPTVFTRSSAGHAPVVRWMRYDSLGRRVLNVEPHTSVGYSPDPATDPSTILAIRYAYDDAGRVVGTSDARGCGQNFFFDAGGREVAVDDSPCTSEHPVYTVPNLVTGDGTESYFRYDFADDEDEDVVDAGCAASNTLRGRLVSVFTRGAKDVASFDARGRQVCSARRVALPGETSASLAARYAPRWYVRTTTLDDADRVTAATTGARSPELLVSGESAITESYAASGVVKGVASSYGPLVSSVVRQADGLPASVTYGDLAATSTTYTYDARDRLDTLYTGRGAPPLWSAPSYPALGTEPTQQVVLENGIFSYDAADNVIGISDLRDGADWPAGAKPVSRTMGYDDLYRVTSVTYSYAAPGGVDAWKSPFAAENANAPSVDGNARSAPHVSFSQRVQEETFSYDWLGNTSSTDDDTHGFYDRSLGTIANGVGGEKPYQLHSADNRALAGVGARGGDLAADYDAAGNLLSLIVRRDGPCLPSGASCTMRFSYAWDERGSLVHARRWDLSGTELTDSDEVTEPSPARAADAELRYTYGPGDERVLKTAVDPLGNERHTVYVFSSLELKRTELDAIAGDYALDAGVEAVYLQGLGRNLGRVTYASESAPAGASGRRHVFLTLPDHLGSTAIVLDRETSELVERGSYTAYGKDESDYRPERWDSFREERRFTGKEEDIEVGLQFFGARYYVAALGRWASPDPLEVHSPGEADANLYAYVGGRAFQAVDPDGRYAALLVGMAIGAIVAGTVNYVQQSNSGAPFNRGDFAWAVAIGTIGGLVGGAIGGAVTGTLSGSAAAAAPTMGQVVATSMLAGGLANTGSGMVTRGIDAARQGENVGEAIVDGDAILTDAMLGMGSGGVLGFGAYALSKYGTVASKDAVTPSDSPPAPKVAPAPAPAPVAKPGPSTSAGGHSGQAISVPNSDVGTPAAPAPSTMSPSGLDPNSPLGKFVYSEFGPPRGAGTALGGAPRITNGSQVTEQVVRDAMEGAPLQSQQAGGVSLPRVQEYVNRLLAGETAPAIKVDGQMIVDGNHRYVAGRILGQQPAIQPWVGGRPGNAVPWRIIPIDPKAW